MSYAPDESKISAALLGRFLTGECTAEEAGYVRAWVASAPVAAGVVELLAEYRANRVVPEQMVDVDALWQGIQSRILSDVTVHGSSLESGGSTREKTTRPALQGMGRQPLRGGVWYTLAGVIMGTIAIIAGQQLGLTRLGGHRVSPMSIYATGNGERANITLPDGSTVALDVASRLDVPADYLAGNHTLRLMGEALFTIRHHDGTPFTVISGSATTRVLGTSFLVRHYATDSNTIVAVRDGKVVVHEALRSMVLTAAQQVAIGQMGSSGVQLADPALFSFATGILTLKGVPFPKAVVELDRWFDADIRLSDPALNTQDLTGEYAAGSLAELTEILAVTYNMRVVRSGRVLTLFPR